MCLSVVLLAAQSDIKATGSSPLAFFKNYFITGDYTVGGTGLWRKGQYGVAAQDIVISGPNKVPANADVVAAFLYIQTAERILGSGILHAKFRGFPLDSPTGGSLAKALNLASMTPWWGNEGPGWRSLITYRADVLRFLPVDATTGKIVVNDVLHHIEVPDFGNDDDYDDGDDGHEFENRFGPHAVGASLLVVYRDPTMPLKAVVIYDGLATKRGAETFIQSIEGFYQASSMNPLARMTHIVGGGHLNLSEKLTIDAQPPVVALNPFVGSSGLRWDNTTFTFAPPGGAASTIVTVQPPPTGPADSLSWSAIVFSTTVQDMDGDGLLDIWESSASTLYDPNGQPLPNLHLMGADPNHKDVFVEIGYMHAGEGTTYGGVPKPGHTHLPTLEALKAVGDAFKNAPVPVHVHFDVGNNYQADPDPDDYIVPFTADPATNLARGGEAIDELATVCTRGTTDPPWVCQFGNYVNSDGAVVLAAFPGTVGWKTGFKLLRDDVIGTTDGSAIPPPPGPTEDDVCDAPGSHCVRRFDRNRKDMFRYALFAHALGLPKAPCLNADGSKDDACQQTNPDFHVPRTNSGIGDFSGGDLMVTLGGFNDFAGQPVGTTFMQGATLMHELGHTFELTHAGAPPLPPAPPEPNCKPNYQSVMNYLFQLRGLFDDNPLHAGVPQMDYSGEVVAGIDEGNLFDGPLVGARYHTGWYAPQGPGTIGSPARKYCNGLDFPSPLPLGQGPMVRVDSTSVTGSIDWNGNGPGGLFSQDLNFDGVPAALNPGSNDWATLLLNQLGKRRNVGALFIDDHGNLAMGPLSLDVGRGETGLGEIGRGETGRGETGRGETGTGDLGRGETGRAETGRGETGRGETGAADEVDTEIAAAAGNSPPNQLRACVIGIGLCVGTALPPQSQFHRIRLDWKPPTVGSVFQYTVFRAPGSAVTPGSAVQVGFPVPAVPGVVDYFLIDNQELPNALFTYYVVADFADADHTRSGPSNFATILAVNDPPVAHNDLPVPSPNAYTINQGASLVVAAPGLLGNDTDVDSPSLKTALVLGPVHGALILNFNGSFTYTPVPSFFGTDTFTYTANDVDPSRTSNVATVTITVVPIAYEFVNVKNLPPAYGVTFKPSASGTLVDLEWRFKINGVVVNSRDALPSVSITGPGGYSKTFIQVGGDCTLFEYNTLTNTWDFDWKPKNAAVGTYYVIVKSGKTGQRFPATGLGFPIVFKKS